MVRVEVCGVGFRGQGGSAVCAVGVVFTTIESVEGVGATAVEGQIGELRALTAALPLLAFPLAMVQR